MNEVGQSRLNVLRVGNIALVIATIAVNALANLLPINGRMTGELSKLYRLCGGAVGRLFRSGSDRAPTGWISVAMIANLTAWLVHSGWRSALGFGHCTWADHRGDRDRRAGVAMAKAEG